MSFRFNTEDVLPLGDRPKAFAFASALLQCFGNGFFYGYAIFSTRLKHVVGISSADVVMLGVLSQTGLGILQYPTTLMLGAAHKRGISQDRLDIFMSIFSSMMFMGAMCSIGAVVYLAEQDSRLSYETSMGVMGLGFFVWGHAVGTTFNSCSTVVNFNNAGNNSKRRRQLVMLSLMVGLGGVFIVIVYHYALQDTASLSTFFFGLGVWYFVAMLIRLQWMKRIRQKNVSAAPSSTSPSRPSHAASFADEVNLDDVGSTPDQSPQTPVAPAPPASERIAPQPLSALLRSQIVWLTSLGTFLGVGTGGTFLSSLGNLGSQLVTTTDLTFSLTLTFLVMQTGGRMANAVAYGFGDWPYVFAFWHAFCLMGVSAFLISPTTTGAFVSAAFVGMSFGGFHSSFPILAATSFPGNPVVDYPQSVGVALAVSSIGCITVGQLTTVVYKAASLEDLRVTGFFGTFLFFVALLIISTLSAVILGKKLQLKKKHEKAQHPQIETVVDQPQDIEMNVRHLSVNETPDGVYVAANVPFHSTDDKSFARSASSLGADSSGSSQI